MARSKFGMVAIKFIGHAESVDGPLLTSSPARYGLSSVPRLGELAITGYSSLIFTNRNFTSPAPYCSAIGPALGCLESCTSAVFWPLRTATR